MKNLYSIIFLICFSNIVLSQIQIERSDYYTHGVKVEKRVDSLNKLEASHVITNPLVFGDYTSQKQFKETITYVNPAVDFPEGNEFMSSNCALKQQFAGLGEVNIVLTISDQGVVLDGMLVASPINPTQIISFKLDDKLDIAKFPILLNSSIEDVGKGEHVIDVIDIKPLFDKLDESGMFYLAFSSFYDKIKIQLDLSIKTSYDESGSLKVNGTEIILGEYDYLREKQILIVGLDLFLREKATAKYKQINSCTIINPADFTKPINLGEEFAKLTGFSFPISRPRYAYNYWTKGMYGAIAELTLNEDFTLVDMISLRSSTDTKIDIIEKNNISCYPNPAKENVNILNAEGKKIYIFDVLGQNVMNINCESDNYPVNVAKLQNGVYILKCQNQTIKLFISK